MKHWQRILMIVGGIMIALILITYTDPTAVRKFIHEKYTSGRYLL
jgi:hypothetical protein